MIGTRLHLFRAIVGGLAWACMAVAASAAQRSSSTVDRFLARTDPAPAQHRALRHLEAQNQHFGASAWMDVWTEADPVGGFRYMVVAEGGSGYIRRRVFLAALDAEQRMWRNGEPMRAELNLTNYVIEDRGITNGFASLSMMPRRKDVLLFDGAVYITPEDGDLVWLEGRLSKNPSIWTRRVEVMRRYGRVAGIRVPVEITSEAHVFIAGRSTFRMTYEYETINGQRVGNPQVRTPSRKEYR